MEEEHDVRLKYDAISEEVEILRSREAMALEDAERLGIQNAELIGHGNGGQKISYVEGLRREMALVKHVSCVLTLFFPTTPIYFPHHILPSSY